MGCSEPPETGRTLQAQESESELSHGRSFSKPVMLGLFVSGYACDLSRPYIRMRALVDLRQRAKREATYECDTSRSGRRHLLSSVLVVQVLLERSVILLLLPAGRQLH